MAPAGSESLDRVPARVRQADIDGSVRRLEGDWTPLRVFNGRSEAAVRVEQFRRQHPY